MSDVVVTGANRGLGLAFARQYVARGCRVFATCRSPEHADALTDLDRSLPGRVVTVRLDLADENSITRCADEICAKSDGLAIVINNAGALVSGESGLDRLDGASMTRLYHVNVAGPLLLTRALRPGFRGGGTKVLFLCSRTGVLREGLPSAGGGYSYGMTKSALHLAIPKCAADLRADGIVVAGLDPGFVETDMTRGFAGNRVQLTPEQSVRGMVEVIDTLVPEDTGRHLRWNGKPCRWYAPAETPEDLQEA